MEETSDSSKEAWNMATATLKRLDNLLNQASFASQTQNFSLWYNALMDLRRNLSPFLEEWKIEVEKNKKTEKISGWEAVSDKFKELPEDWLIYGGKINPEHFQKVYLIFDSIFIICLKCMKEKGLLMPKPIDVKKSIYQMG